MSNFNAIKGNELDRRAKIYIPDSFFDQDLYPDSILSYGAMIAYGHLCRRVNLSREKGLIDDNGDVYVLYEQEELAWRMRTTEKSIRKYLGELENANVLKQVPQGKNRPKLLYVGEPQLPENGYGIGSWRDEKARRALELEKNVYSKKVVPSPTDTRTGKNDRSDNENIPTEGTNLTAARTGKNDRSENVVTGKNDRSEIPNFDKEGTSLTAPMTGHFYRSENDPLDRSFLPTSLLKDLSSLKDLKSLKIKDMPQGGDSRQGHLINMPTRKSEPTKPTSRSNVELAKIRIYEARQTGNWDKVTDSNFTYYYQQAHSDAGLSPLTVNPYTDVTIMRNFIARYQLPREKVCEYLDHILMQYLVHPKKYKNILTYNMLEKQVALLFSLVSIARNDIEPELMRSNSNNYSKEQEENRKRAEAEGWADLTF